MMQLEETHTHPIQNAANITKQSSKLFECSNFESGLIAKTGSEVLLEWMASSPAGGLGYSSDCKAHAIINLIIGCAHDCNYIISCNEGLH